MMQSCAAPEPPRPSTFEWTLIAFVYWVIFMGALTPGNINDIRDAGAAPNLALEAARLGAAGVLGASVTPLLLLLARHAPISHGRIRRNLAVQAAAVIALATGLIVVSCFLAAWLLAGRLLPSVEQVTSQIFADFLLLVLCITLLLAAIQATAHLRGIMRGEESTDWPERLAIGERGRLKVVELDTVEWIETQGNYQAVHSSEGVHLYRDTLARLEATLDPCRFVRIHRRRLIAQSKVRAVEPLSSGDAIVVMESGARLRQSRQYRSALRRALRD